jgi:hypothetical protein
MLVVVLAGRGGGGGGRTVLERREKTVRKARRWVTVGVNTVRMCRAVAVCWRVEVRRGW